MDKPTFSTEIIADFCTVSGLTLEEGQRLFGLLNASNRNELLLTLAFIEGVKIGTYEESERRERCKTVLVRFAKGDPSNGPL